MKNIRTIPLAMCVCVLFSSCSAREGMEDLRKQVAEHKARSLANWQDLQQKPFEDRILPAPDLLLDYLRLDNRLNGYAGVPTAPKDWRPFASDVHAVMAEFPPPVQKHLRDHVLGVFLVTDLGSTAYNDAFTDFPSHHMGFIVLDVSALDQAANAWATWREKTPFSDSSDIQVTVRIADDRQDDRRHAISFTLLHELGHLVGAAKSAHSLWWAGGNPSVYPFSAQSWKLENGNIVSRWDNAFRDRHKVRFYATEQFRLPSSALLGAYSQLLKTDFVSLYASTGVYEDFAETYAMYVHVVMQKRPWTLSVAEDGITAIECTTPILQDRCKEKSLYISRLMTEGSQPTSAGDVLKAAPEK